NPIPTGCSGSFDIVVPSIGSYFSPASDSFRTVRSDSSIDDDVAVAVDELIQRISPSPSPPASHSPVGGLTLPFSTVPPISDSERNSSPPFISPVGPDFDIKDSEQRVDPLKLCHDPDSDEVDLYPSDLEVRELFHDPPLYQKFDFVGLTCIECRRRFYSVGGFENHLLAAHDVRLDNPSSSPSEGCRVAVGETVPPSGLFPLTIFLDLRGRLLLQGFPRTAKSRQDHLLIHDLEDAFDEIHGISASSGPSDFADCRVPCPGSP
ncbi:hypothetical protein CDAR_403781, partial [Caerostris darwini]